MKFTAAFITALLVIASLSACTPPSEQPPLDEDASVVVDDNENKPEVKTPTESLSPNTFKLSRLPDIGKFTGSGEIYERYYPQLTEKLIPRDDYGLLIPFIGGERSYESAEEWGEGMSVDYNRYGLCTVDGKIVVDAVYSYIPQFKSEPDGAEYYVLNKDIGIDKEKYAQLFETTLIKADGSWKLELGDANIDRISKDGITVSSGNIMSSDKVVYKLLDFDGNVKYQSPDIYDWASIGKFSEGGKELASVDFSAYSNDAGVNEGIYIDKNGSTVLSGFASGDDFTAGYAIVQIPDKDAADDEKFRTKCGIIDENGKYVLEPVYDYISMSEKQMKLLITKDSECYLADFGNGVDIEKSMKLLEGVQNGNPSFCGKNDDIICCYGRFGSYYSYYYANSGELFVSKETGETPNRSCAYNADVYLYSDPETNKGYFLDGEGNTLICIDNCPEYFNMLDDRYMTLSIGNSYDDTYLYDLKEGKEVGFFEQTYAWDIIGEKYIVMTRNNKDEKMAGQFYEKPKNYLYNAETGETVLDNIESVNKFTADGKTYIGYSDDNYVYTTDENLNIIIKMKKEYND